MLDGKPAQRTEVVRPPREKPDRTQASDKQSPPHPYRADNLGQGPLVRDAKAAKAPVDAANQQPLIRVEDPGRAIGDAVRQNPAQVADAAYSTFQVAAEARGHKLPESPPMVAETFDSAWESGKQWFEARRRPKDGDD